VNTKVEQFESAVLNEHMNRMHKNPLFRPFYQKPTMNYKPCERTTMPSTINPDNFVQPSQSELLANKERQEIRGRLRRHYWNLAYHPVNGKHWDPMIGDPMISKYSHARSVWHIEDTFQLKGIVRNKAGMFALSCIGAFALYAFNCDPWNENTQKSIVDWVVEGKVSRE